MDIKQKFLELQDKALQVISEEIYARIVKPEMIRREEEQKRRMNSIFKEAIRNTEKKEDHPKAVTVKPLPKLTAETVRMFAGVDINVYIGDEPWQHVQAYAGIPPKRQEPYGKCQAVSWNINRDTNQASGTLIDLVNTDGLPFPEGEFITVVATNEYGYACVLFEGEDFQILNSASGISCDDIVMEQEHTFRCKFVGSYPLPTPEVFMQTSLKSTFEDWHGE